MNKTKIEKKLKRKTDQDLVETIILGKKKSKWLEVSHLISAPRRTQIAINLDQINSQTKDNEVVIIPGKVLSEGELDKKVKIAALYFSSKALEKLKKAKIETLSIREEINKNPDAKNIKIIKQVR